MNSKSLQGKKGVVTGASRGIGRATALALAARGMELALVARSAEPLETLARDIQSHGGRAVAFPADFRDTDSLPSLAESLQHSLGDIDCLVNNAGVFFERELERMTVGELDGVFRVNFVAPFVLTRGLLPGLRKTHGRVINVASVSALQGYHGQSAYGASKAALVGLMRALAQEVRNDRVHIHNLCPGGVDTELIHGTQLGERLRGQVMIQSEDIAKTVVFLAEQSDNIDLEELVIRRFK